MDYSRRDFGKIALAGVPAAALLGNSQPLFGAALAQAKPNSLINGVQIGVITYSYGRMGDSSAEATLKYIVDSGLSGTELMGGPVDDWMRKKGNPPASAAAGGGRGGGGGRGAAAPGAPGDPAAAAAGGRRGGGAPPAPVAADPSDTRSWNGQPCPAGRGGGGGRAAAPAGAPAAQAAPAVQAAAGAAAAAPAAGGGGGGRGGAPQTPEQQAAAAELRKWRLSLPMSLFRDLRKLYNDAGVSIYAVKNLQVGATDEDLDFQFTVAKTLGASHVTAELPGGTDAAAIANFKRVGDMALKHGMFAAYHTHAQGSLTIFDAAFAASKGNMANVDLGHFVAGGGDPLAFLNKFHDRISSFHLKDRTRPEHCTLNLPWGQGETPIKEILQTVKKNKYKTIATIELEYQVPQGSNDVQEVRKCLEYCRAALA